MLTHPTLDQLHQLGLAGMARAFEELSATPRGAELDHAEWLGLLLDRELTDRQDRRLKARLRYARLRHQAAVEDVDYRTPRGLDRALFQKLATGGWIEAKQNLIIEGPTGVDVGAQFRLLTRAGSRGRSQATRWDTGIPSLVIRFSTAQPVRASVF